MERKLTSERCVSLADLEAAEIKARCVRWAQDNAVAIENWPRMAIETLNDRAGDTFEPLLVIGAVAGGGWLESLSEAAVKLCSYANTEPEAASLLLDIMSVFVIREAKRVFSRDLAAALRGKAGWVALYIHTRGRFDEVTVAQTLRRYHIRPTTVRIGPEVSKGYKWEEILGALERYTPKEEIRRRMDELKGMNELALQAQQEAAQIKATEQAQQTEQAAHLQKEPTENRQQTPLQAAQLAHSLLRGDLLVPVCDAQQFIEKQQQKQSQQAEFVQGLLKGDLVEPVRDAQKPTENTQQTTLQER